MKMGKCLKYLCLSANTPVQSFTALKIVMLRSQTLRLTSLFSLCHFYLPVHMLFSVHLSVVRASPWQERSLSTTVPANQSDVSHRSSDN